MQSPDASCRALLLPLSCLICLALWCACSGQTDDALDDDLIAPSLAHGSEEEAEAGQPSGPFYRRRRFWKIALPLLWLIAFVS